MPSVIETTASDVGMRHTRRGQRHIAVGKPVCQQDAKRIFGHRRQIGDRLTLARGGDGHIVGRATRIAT